MCNLRPTLPYKHLPTILEVKAKHSNPIVFVDEVTHYLVSKDDVNRLPSEVQRQLKYQVNYSMGYFRRSQFDTILNKSVKAGNRVAILTKL
jgi:DNA mismatch repair ATPase MutS